MRALSEQAMFSIVAALSILSLLVGCRREPFPALVSPDQLSALSKESLIERYGQPKETFSFSAGDFKQFNAEKRLGLAVEATTDLPPRLEALVWVRPRWLLRKETLVALVDASSGKALELGGWSPFP